MLAELQQRKQALKQAATTPVERATIEIVAMMFQSILTEDRIPAAIRVWFARLHDGFRLVGVAKLWRGAQQGGQTRGASGRGLSRHRPARVPDRVGGVREVPRAFLQERKRGLA